MESESSKSVWERDVSAPAAGAVIAVAIVVLNFSACSSVGYLSDDIPHLQVASKIDWWHPLAGHHVSPLITLFYKAAHRGVLSVEGWHMIALALHFVNAMLIYRLVSVGLKGGKLTATLCSVLFITAPAALEAILWPAAFCFVPLLGILLISLTSLFRALDSSGMPPFGSALWLGVLQLAGFFVWDWGIAIAPILVAVAIAGVDGKLDSAALRGRAKLLAPSVALWCAFLVYHGAVAAELGYGLFPLGLLRASQLLAAIPGMILTPQLPKPAIIGVAGAWLVLVAWALLRDRRLWPLVATFAILQLPWFFQGAPTSRYAYLSFAFASASLVLALRALLPARVALVLLAVMVLLQTAGYVDRSRSWQVASRDAQQIGRELEKIARQLPAERLLVVVNLPDHETQTRGLWPPPMWRNGLEVLHQRSRKIFTPAYAARFEPDAPIVMARPQIRAAHPGATIVEVTGPAESAASGGPAYTIAPL